MDWTKGRELQSLNESKFKYTFAKDSTDVDARWRVYLRDARGSVVVGEPLATFFISPSP